MWKLKIKNPESIRIIRDWEGIWVENRRVDDRHDIYGWKYHSESCQFVQLKCIIIVKGWPEVSKYRTKTEHMALFK
jgi:hypothetical protein